MDGQRPGDLLNEPPVGDPPAAPESRKSRKRRGRHAPASGSAGDRARLWPLLTALAACALIAMLLYTLSRLAQWNGFQRTAAEDQTETLADGVVINGVAMGGLDDRAALALLNRQQTQDARAFQYRIIAGDRVWFMTQDDLPLSHPLGTLVSRAMAATRALRLSRGQTVDSPFSARQRLRDQARREGLPFTSLAGYQTADVERYVQGIAGSVDRAPVSAALSAVDFQRRSFSFSDDVPGRQLDQKALTAAITALLDAGETDADITAIIETTPARMTRLRLMNTFGCLEIRSFETRTAGNDAEVRALAEALNGVIVPGGETVSLRGLAEGAVSDYAAANAGRFASAVMDAGLCAGMTLVERSGAEDTPAAERGLDARLDAEADLRLGNPSASPLCVLCYYTPHDGRGRSGSVTLEVYGILRDASESAELSAEVIETLPAGEPEVQINPDLEPGTTLLRREARDGARVRTLLLRKSNGRTYSTDIVATWTYPAVRRLIETSP